jgi:hypothetical protein
LKDYDYFVVHGGRNDKMFDRLGSSAMSDIHVLNLKFMAWCQVKIGNIDPGPCYNFSSASYGSRIFRFGGVNDASYVDGKMWILELDQGRAYDLIKLQKKMKR